MTSSEPPTSDAGRRWMDVSRIVFFNDAIFAIAMTVLVFGFRVPEDLGQDAGPKLDELIRSEWDDFAGYFLSFAVLAFYWVSHHRLFDHVVRADRWLLYLNLTFLAFVALLPYPSELIQHYGDSEAAVLLWSATIAAAGTMFTLIVVHVGRANLLDEQYERRYHHHALVRHATVPLVFGLSIPVAVVSVTAAKIVWLAVFVCYFVFWRRYGSIHDAH